MDTVRATSHSSMWINIPAKQQHGGDHGEVDVDVLVVAEVGRDLVQHHGADKLHKAVCDDILQHTAGSANIHMDVTACVKGVIRFIKCKHAWE